MATLVDPLKSNMKYAAPQVEEVKPAAPTKTAFESRLESIRQSGTEAEKTVVRHMDEYVQAMVDGVDPNIGVKHKRTLRNMIHYVIEKAPADEFNKLWTLLLNYFHQHRDGVLNMYRPYRFAEYWEWDDEELDSYQRMVNLLLLTANPEERANGLKRVSIPRTLEIRVSEAGRNKILAFYGI